jgi:hypothetical protein
MLRKKLAVLLAMAVTLVMMLASAGMTSAQPPAGSAATCPPRYQAMTLEALLAQAERLGVPEDRARNLFNTVNKNQDAWICQTKLPGDATDINFVDNQAVGLDRS